VLRSQPPATASPNCGLVDIPAGFAIQGRSFVDQDPSTTGTQVRVDLVQGFAGILQRVSFQTADIINTSNGTPAGVNNIGRTNGAGDNGSFDGRCFNVGGTPVAFGLHPSKGRVAWTPSWNAGSVKLVTMAQVAGFAP
jgi:hypothetical protein